MHRLYLSAHKKLTKLLDCSHINNQNVTQILGKFNIGSVQSSALFMLPKDQFRLLMKTPCPVSDPAKQQETIHIGKRLRELLHVQQKKVCMNCPIRQKCHIARKNPKELNLPQKDYLTQTLLYTQALTQHPNALQLDEKHWLAGYKVIPSLVHLVDTLHTNKQEVQQFMKIKKSITTYDPHAPPKVQIKQQKTQIFDYGKDQEKYDKNDRQRERGRDKKMERREDYQQIPRNRISRIQQRQNNQMDYSKNRSQRFERQREGRGSFDRQRETRGSFDRQREGRGQFNRQRGSFNRQRGSFDKERGSFDRKRRSFDENNQNSYGEKQFDNRKEMRGREYKFDNYRNNDRYDKSERYGKYDNYNTQDRQKKQYERKPRRQANDFEYSKNTERYGVARRYQKIQKGQMRDQNELQNPIIKGYNRKPKGDTTFKQKWKDNNENDTIQSFFKEQVTSQQFKRTDRPPKNRNFRQTETYQTMQKPDKMSEIKKTIIIDKDIDNEENNSKNEERVGRKIRRKTQ